MDARRLRFLTGLALAGGLWAATLDGPRLGLVFDSAHRALRPILGIPGAAILGEPLKLGLDLHKAAVSPRQDYVLATTGEQREVVLLTIGRGPVVRTAIRGADAAPDQIVFSAGGHVAALHYKDRSRIQVLSGLPGAPRITGELYLSAGRSPSALAVGDDGRTVLAGMGNSVYWVSASGDAPILTDLRKITAITLVASRTAFIADAADNQIYRVRDVTGAAETDVVAGPEEGIADPVALAVSHDGARAFVANGKSGSVIIVELRGAAGVTKVGCGCTPTGLDRLAGDNVFRLTEPSSRPMWVLDAGAREPRVVFVPAEMSRSSEK